MAWEVGSWGLTLLRQVRVTALEVAGLKWNTLSWVCWVELKGWTCFWVDMIKVVQRHPWCKITANFWYHLIIQTIVRAYFLTFPSKRLIRFLSIQFSEKASKAAPFDYAYYGLRVTALPTSPGANVSWPRAALSKTVLGRCPQDDECR